MRTDGILFRHYGDRWNSFLSLWGQMEFLFVTMRTDGILFVTMRTDGILFVTMREDKFPFCHYGDRWNSFLSLCGQMEFLFVTMRKDKFPFCYYEDR